MLSTVNLSDIGQTLVAFENEITANNSSMEYYEREIEKLKVKNAALRAAAKSLILNAAPTVYKVEQNGEA